VAKATFARPQESRPGGNLGFKVWFAGLSRISPFPWFAPKAAISFQACGSRRVLCNGFASLFFPLVFAMQQRPFLADAKAPKNSSQTILHFVSAWQCKSPLYACHFQA
jgi:hypothetical protein